MNKIKFISIVLFAALVLVSCHKGNDQAEAPLKADQGNVIEITSNQFASSQMEIGNPVPYLFQDIVHAKGYVRVPDDGIAQISVILPGKANHINYDYGEYVKKGATLFMLEGEAIIQLQQDYAQYFAQLGLAKIEMDRQEALSKENISSQKELQLARSNFQSINAVCQGLKARLGLVNIAPTEVEAGRFVSSIAICSPISGFISERNLIQGEVVDPQKKTFEIIDIQQNKLFVNVFENDIAGLEVGQRVLFYEPDRKDKVFEAELVLIGKSIDEVSKTIPCVAKIIKDSNYAFVNGMYAECSIITSEVNSNAVPSEAVIKDGFNNYLLVKTGINGDVLTFSKVSVEIGRQEIDFTEVLTEGLKDVLIKGTYNLNSSN